MQIEVTRELAEAIVAIDDLLFNERLGPRISKHIHVWDDLVVAAETEYALMSCIHKTLFRRWVKATMTDKVTDSNE